MTTYPALRDDPNFAPVYAAVDSLVGRLRDEGTGWSHHRLERVIQQEGREILRLAMQGAVDERSQAEATSRPRTIKGRDGVPRTHRKRTSRVLGVLFGCITVHRLALAQRRGSALRPLDKELELPQTKYSLGVRREVSRAAVSGSFDNVVARMEETFGLQLGKRQVEEMAIAASVDFDAFYEHRPRQLSLTDDFLVMSSDGKGVVMRTSDLRAKTRAAALTTNRNSGIARDREGGSFNRKRRALVGAVYTVASQVRTPGQVVGCRPWPASSKPPVLHDKVVWASLTTTVDEQTTRLFDEAERRDPHQAKTWLALVDGESATIESIRRQALRRKKRVVLILDVIHAIQYLWRAAKALPLPVDERDGWVHRHLMRLLAGRVKKVIEAIRQLASTVDAKTRRELQTVANYFHNHRRMMQYGRFLQMGAPIATGVIEGTCRHLINDRLDITGARWGLTGAHAVLQLRALWANGDFHDYWDFHCDQVRRRTYSPDYADVPEALAA